MVLRLPHANAPLSGNVLVLGDNDLAALAIVRSLGRASLRVHLCGMRSPADHPAVSVCTSDSEVRGNPRENPHAFLESLSHELQREHFDLVIPVTDESLLLLHREREFLSRYSRLALPNEQGLEYTHNKIKTIELARECGLATPETQVVCDPTEVNGLEVPDDSPVVLKPAFSYSLVDPYAGRLQVRIVKPGMDFRQRLVDMLRSSPVLVQEFCRGHGVGLSVLGYHGEVLAAFQHERVHEPPEGGASTYRKSMPISPHLFNGVSRMCQSMEWHGPAMFEFKGDASDGR